MSNQSEKAYERVLNYIKEEIRSGSLRNGEQLPPERELAELLGVSRNMVREALRTMSLMGFVSSVQGAGNFISCNLEKNITESFRMMLLLGETNELQVSQLRRGLESESARLAAGRILPGQLTKLDGLVERMRQEKDMKKSAALHREFHHILSDASGNRLIRALLSSMYSGRDMISAAYVRVVSDEEMAGALHDAHGLIVKALKSRDEMNAILAMRKHFEVLDSTLDYDKG